MPTPADYRALIRRVWLGGDNLQPDEYERLLKPAEKPNETALDCAIRLAGLSPIDWTGTEGNTTAKRDRLAAALPNHA